MNKRHYYLRPPSVVLKVFVVYTLTIMLFVNLLHAQCPDNIFVSTQAEIDAFPLDYPNCTEVEGIVAIDNGSDVTNLDGFSNIVSIGGELLIRDCPLLMNVDGLSNLTYIGLGIEIYTCDVLQNLNGLSNLTFFNGFSIHMCDSLENLHGLENIASSPTMFNVSLCESLTELTSFPNLSFVNGYLGLSGLPSLTSLSGLENLDSIAEAFFLGDNTSLTNVDGLEGLVSIGRDFQIFRNYNLENLEGLSGLQSIGWNLQINKCNALTSLSGLDSLQYVGRNLMIDENNSLQTLAGIDNIKAESIQNLSITYNPQLSTCDVLSICNYLASPNGDIQIYVNATGCNNSVEVIEACTVGVPEQETDHNISAYPNPFTTSTTIEYEVYTRSDIQYTVYNSVGEAVVVGEEQNVMPGNHTITLSLHNLPAGLYYVVLRSEDGVSISTIIKQ